MSLTWSQIYRETDGTRRKRARSTVVISNLKLGLSRKTGNAVAAARVFSLDKTSGGLKRNRYVTSVMWLSARDLELSCSCADFTYRAEWFLHQKGAAQIRYSNGERPEKWVEWIGCCKHILALYAHLKAEDLVAPATKWMRRPKAERDAIMKERRKKSKTKKRRRT